jgi:AcrR family transcriptional regulator
MTTLPDRPERALQILDAADELFGEVGHAAVSMRDVAVRAGVNKALLFYYWGSKEALFEAVLDRYYAAHRDALAGALAADLPLRPRLHGVIDTYFRFISENRRYPRLVQSLVVGGPGWHPFLRKNLEPMVRWLEGALAEVAPTEGPRAAKHLFLDISGAVIHTFTYAPVLERVWGADPLGDDALAERLEHLHWLADALLDGLGAPAATSRTTSRAAAPDPPRPR